MIGDRTQRGGLAACLNAPGARSMAEACSRADLHLVMIEDKALSDLRQSLAAISALALAGEPHSTEARDEWRALASSITALGGMFGREALSQAAYSLRALLDELDSKWNAEAVAVHVHALQLLFEPRCVSAEAQKNLIDGLKRVRECVLARNG